MLPLREPPCTGAASGADGRGRIARSDRSPADDNTPPCADADAGPWPRRGKLARDRACRQGLGAWWALLGRPPNQLHGRIELLALAAAMRLELICHSLVPAVGPLLETTEGRADSGRYTASWEGLGSWPSYPNPNLSLLDTTTGRALYSLGDGNGI